MYRINNTSVKLLPNLPIKENTKTLIKYTKHAKQYYEVIIQNMSESQLPEDCRSRIQQGFAASLLLTSLLFFWILLVSNEPPGVGEGLYRGGGGLPPNQLAAGGLPPNHLAAGPRPPRKF